MYPGKAAFAPALPLYCEATLRTYVRSNVRITVQRHRLCQFIAGRLPYHSFVQLWLTGQSQAGTTVFEWHQLPSFPQPCSFQATTISYYSLSSTQGPFQSALWNEFSHCAWEFFLFIVTFYYKWEPSSPPPKFQQNEQNQNFMMRLALSVSQKSYMHPLCLLLSMWSNPSHRQNQALCAVYIFSIGPHLLVYWAH